MHGEGHCKFTEGTCNTLRRRAVAGPVNHAACESLFFVVPGNVQCSHASAALASSCPPWDSWACMGSRAWVLSPAPCCHLSPVLAMIYSWDGECCMSPHQSSCSVVEALCVCALQVSQSPAVAIRSSMPMTPAAALNGTHNRDFAIQMAAHHTVCEGSFV
jgi:hypothetical protein